MQSPELALPVELGQSLVVVLEQPLDDPPAEGVPNNGDGHANPGEALRLPLRVINQSGQPQPEYTLALKADPALLVLEGEPVFGPPLGSIRTTGSLVAWPRCRPRWTFRSKRSLWSRVGLSPCVSRCRCRWFRRSR